MHEYLGTFVTFVKETKSEQPTDDKGNETTMQEFTLITNPSSQCG